MMEQYSRDPSLLIVHAQQTKALCVDGDTDGVYDILFGTRVRLELSSTTLTILGPTVEDEDADRTYTVGLILKSALGKATLDIRRAHLNRQGHEVDAFVELLRRLQRLYILRDHRIHVSGSMISISNRYIRDMLLRFARHPRRTCLVVDSLVVPIHDLVEIVEMLPEEDNPELCGIRMLFSMVGIPITGGMTFLENRATTWDGMRDTVDEWVDDDGACIERLAYHWRTEQTELAQIALRQITWPMVASKAMNRPRTIRSTLTMGPTVMTDGMTSIAPTLHSEGLCGVSRKPMFYVVQGDDHEMNRILFQGFHSGIDQVDYDIGHPPFGDGVYFFLKMEDAMREIVRRSKIVIETPGWTQRELYFKVMVVVGEEDEASLRHVDLRLEPSDGTTWRRMAIRGIQGDPRMQLPDVIEAPACANRAEVWKSLGHSDVQPPVMARCPDGHVIIQRRVKFTACSTLKYNTSIKYLILFRVFAGLE